MSTIDQAPQAHQRNYARESTMRAYRNSASNSDILLNTPPRNESLLMPEASTTGSIREYSRVGDGAHNSRHQQMLPHFIERAWQRPQILVRKVTVMGSHVLRYVSRSTNLFPRRQHRESRQRAQLARSDQHMHNDNAFDYDQLGSDWLAEDFHADLVDSRRLRLQPDTDRQMLQSDTENTCTRGLFNWRICLGMLCIIAAQALLKIAFDEVYHMS